MPRPNILLIVLDATRADACSCYGADRPTTPCLDSVAQGGTLFEQAITAAPWTLPAFASIFTGQYPGQLGIDESRRLHASVPTLAERLAAHGYATFAITSNIWLGPTFGLSRGFDRLHKLWQLFQTREEMSRVERLVGAGDGRERRSSASRWLKGNPVKNLANAAYGRWWAFRRDYGAARTAGPLMRWLHGRSGPWFACVHFLEAHLEYRPPRDWAQRFARNWDSAQALLRADQWRMIWRHMTGAELLCESRMEALHDLYWAEVAYTDHHLGRLLQALRTAQALDDTLLVITADHGENLGEHGLLNHQYGVFDSLLRVPLVVHYPELFPAGQRVAGQVQTLDLFRTLLEAAGADVPATPGQSLLPGKSARHAFTVAEYGMPKTPDAQRLRRYGLEPEQVRPFLRGLTALRTEEHKLIVGTDGTLSLYNWRQDPGEVHNLAAEEPEKVRELQRMLERFHKEHGIVPQGGSPAAEEMDPVTAARLMGLGYIE
jgi:arylsulfatase A-like enzyme